MRALFALDGRVEIFHNQAGTPVPVAEIAGAEAIERAVAEMMRPHPPRGWSHHTTHDPIVEATSDTATINAQFVMFETLGDERPVSGWADGTVGAQGTVLPGKAGYYRATLERTGDAWKIVTQRIVSDLPMAFPGA